MQKTCYHVLLAEDEERERNLLTTLLEHQYPQMFTFTSAENGLIALDLLRSHTFDLTFLDINMPGMTGLEVIEQLKSKPYCVILTAYNYFEYAKQAIALGVNAFLLKPPIRRELYKVVDQFMEHMTAVAGESHQQMRIEDALQQLCMGDVNTEVTPALQALGIQTDTAICLYLQCESNCLEATAQTVSFCKKYFNDQHMRCEGISTASGTRLVLFHDLAITTTLFSQLHQSLQVAFAQQVKLLWSDPIPVARIPVGFQNLLLQEHAHQPTTQVLDKLIQQFEQAMEASDYAAALPIVEQIVPIAGAIGEENRIKVCIIAGVGQLCGTLRNAEHISAIHQKLEEFIGTKNQQQVLLCAQEIFQQLIAFTAKPQDTIEHAVIRAMIERVEADVAENWTLDFLASEYAMNAYYLSHLFKKTTGKRFSDFLLTCRMENAKELLQNPNLSIMQIAQMVGYSDANYFSRVFKKYYACTAQQMRNQRA